MRNSIHHVYVQYRYILLLKRPDACYRTSATRRCDNGSSGGGEGARMTFLQGGPKFEVTPLPNTRSVLNTS